MANRLIRLTPVSIATSTPDAGAAFDQINTMPVNGLTHGAAGVCIDRSENIYVCDSSNHVIYRYQKGAAASQIFAGAYGQSGHVDGAYSAARFNQPTSICVDNSGFLYVIDSGSMFIRRIDQNANVFTVASIPASAGSARGIAVDFTGNIYYLDATS